MTSKDEALKMAIIAMQSALSNQGTMLLSDPPQSAWKFYGCENKLKEAFEACKKALEHPAPSWQGLSDDEKLAIIRKWKDEHTMRAQELIGLGDAFEQALKEKNGKV